MEGLYFSLGLILSALFSGYLLQRTQLSGLIHLNIEIGALRKTLQKIGLLFFMPISFLGAVWVVSLTDLRVVFLPLIGVIALLAGGALGLVSAKILHLQNKQKGVLYCCGSFTNIGAIGSLVCFMFLGEAGFALVALYKMFEEITYYTIGFPIARFYGGSNQAQGNIYKRILGVFTDPFVATVLSAFFLGLFLNLSGINRPIFMEKITAFFVPMGTFILIFSIGLGMRFTRVADHLVACSAVAIIKFLCIPFLACALAYFLGLQNISDGLPFKVVIILSSMPVAFNALVAASIFDLDLDLANSLWLVSTGLLIIILPWLYFLTSTL